MKKFWIVVLHDHGDGIQETSEPVMASGKSEIDKLISQAAEVARERYLEYNDALLAAQKAVREKSSTYVAKVAQRTLEQTRKNMVRYVNINGFKSENVIDSQGGTADDFQILTDDEFFNHQAKRSPALDENGNIVRYVEVSVSPLVPAEEMDEGDLDEDGVLLVSSLYLISISGLAEHVSKYEVEDLALDEFFAKAPIACRENFSVTGSSVDHPKTNSSYGGTFNRIEQDYCLPTP